MIKVHSLHKSYRSGAVLINVNFALSNQEIVTVIGPSGAGKTTLARILLNLEKPSSGSISCPQDMISSYLPQKLNLNNYLTIDSQTLFNYLVGAKKASDEIYQTSIDFANLSKIAYRQVQQLSGGEIRRLLIAATLARQSDFIIFDEPTQNLDLESQQQFYHLLNERRKNSNTAVMLISHDLYTVMRYADQVLCLNGHLCCFGKPSSELTSSYAPYSEVINYQHIHDHIHSS